MARFAGSGPEAEALSSRMMDAWIAFARTGNPACDALPSWPAYDRDARATMVFDETCQTKNGPLDEERASWD
jgi:para-nitrobenzyl esterase